MHPAVDVAQGRSSEEPRDVRGARWAPALVQDARYALRQAIRYPVFSAIVTLTIALGIGAATAIFGVVDAVMLRPLPFADGGRIVSLWATNPDKSIRRFAAG